MKFVQYNQAKSFTAEVDGKYTFYVNARNEVYVSLPEVEYLVRVNDKLVDVEDLEVKGNVLSFEIELELLDEVVVTANNKALPLGSEKDAETKFVAKVSGKHTFYVNDNEEVYVVESEKPVTEYKVLVDDEEVKITPLKDNDNNLVFELTLAKDEKVVVKGDDEALAFPSYNNIKYFKAARAGKHTFYVNKDNKVYVTEPEIPYVVLVNDEEVESEDLNVEGNKFTFKLKLEVDDVLKVSYDNKTLKDKDGNASFKATSKGTHTITVNDENVFAVKQPLVANFEIVVKKNNQVIEVEDLEDGENYLSFEIELEKDDVLAVFYGETQATNSPFTATKEGLHKVYLNKDKELYVVEPAKEFVVKVNNEVVEVTPFESGDDLLAFEIELENGDVVAITYDGAAIKDEYKHSTYTAELDGVHTFYVNENEVLYVDDAKAKVANWNGTITVDVSAIDWFGNNDAVAYIHIWYTDGSGTTWGSCPEMTKKSANVYTYASDTSKTVSGFVVIRGSKSNT